MVKNPHADVGDTGLIPGPGRCHGQLEQLSLCATAKEPVLSSLGAAATGATAVRGLGAKLEESLRSSKDPHSQEKRMLK